MSNTNEAIVEVFGQFGYQVEGKLKLVDTREEAELAVAAAEVGEAARARAAGYCAFKGIESKNAVGKINIISDFLAWEAAGSPEAPAEEEQGELEVETPDEAPSLDA